MNQNSFFKALSFVSKSMASDDVRSYLNGVLFEFNPGTLTLVGTDGSRLSYITIKYEHNIQGFTHYIADRSDVKYALKCYEDKTTYNLDIGEADGKLVLFNGKAMVNMDSIEGTYPDYRRVFYTKGAEVDDTIGFDPNFIKSAMDGLKILQDKTVMQGCKIEHGDSKSMASFKPTELHECFGDSVTECGVVIKPMDLDKQVSEKAQAA